MQNEITPVRILCQVKNGDDETTYSESKQKAGLADARVADHKHLEEIVAKKQKSMISISLDIVLMTVKVFLKV